MQPNAGAVRPRQVTGGRRYQRLGPIASGGMGTVYLGRMISDDTTQTVAMKVLHPHLADNSDMVAMFLDEARVATRLRHPNLVGVLAMDLVGDELVIVMEYVEGITLGAALSSLRQRGSNLPIGLAARIVIDALAGLHEVHELLDEKREPLGLVHRDVSPHNLLVGSDGVTRVTDFGVALAAGRLATTRPDGTIKGKLQYLAPEQVGRKPLDRRVDIFAAGIVLWECLTYCVTGERLFEAPTEAEAVTRVLRDPIAPPSMERPEVSLEVDEVCLRALERDPTRRFGTAAEFAEALRSAVGPIPSAAELGSLVFGLASEPILRQRASLERASAAPPPSLPVRRRRPKVSVAGAVVLGCLVLGVAAAALLESWPRRPPVEVRTFDAPQATAVPPALAPPAPPATVPATALATAAAPSIEPPPRSVPLAGVAFPAEAAAASPVAKSAEHNAALHSTPAARSAPIKHPKPSRPFMPDDL